MNDFKAIDAVCNLYVDDPDIALPDWLQTFLGGTIGVDEQVTRGLSPEAFVDKMDRAGIEHAFLIAVRSGSYLHTISRRIEYETVARFIEKYPTRFSGLAGVDPTEGMRGIRALEHAIKDLGFVGAHLYPHWFELAPDHAKYYPFYAKCCELDVPIQMQVGHCLRYSPDRPLRSVGRPITLDTIACDFPELKLVGIHLGWPWTEEMISVAYKHPNVYIGSDAYAPKHWPKEFIRFIDSWGQDKVLFGTDFPVIDNERAIREIAELPLRDAARKKFLRNNVIKLYNLPLPLA